MSNSTAQITAIGIDCTSGREAFTYAALDRDLRVVQLAEAEMEGLLALLRSQDSLAVSVNSPSHVNAGIIRKRLVDQRGSQHGIRGAEIREAEYELRGRGISLTATPRLEALCAGWVQLGFELYRRLVGLSFKPFATADAPRQWLETQPQAGFCALLGRSPLPRPSLEGRLQRSLVLFEHGVRIPDPMAFLEEITRHRLLHGSLPMELVASQEQLDALIAAYTAWLASMRPFEICQLGNQQEGYITLPTRQLLAKY